METTTLEELCRRYVDNTTSPYIALLVMETTDQNKEPKQWHMYVINKHATDNPTLEKVLPIKVIILMIYTYKLLKAFSPKHL